MSFLKAFGIIAFWIFVSFVWVSLGQAKERECLSYGSVETWMQPYPVLNEWYKFYVDKHACQLQGDDFFKILASSEPLATKLNQAKVKFDQFYIPLSNLVNINWDSIKDGKLQNIQSDLSLIDVNLKKALSNMKSADQDYFRSIVLFDLPSEFAAVGGPPGNMKVEELMLTRRLNTDRSAYAKYLPMPAKEVNQPPYKKIYPYGLD